MMPAGNPGTDSAGVQLGLSGRVLRQARRLRRSVGTRLARWADPQELGRHANDLIALAIDAQLDGQRQLAECMLGLALELSPTRDALFFQAALLREAGDVRAAQSIYRRLLHGDSGPNAAAVLQQMAEAACEAGDYPAAEPLFARANREAGGATDRLSNWLRYQHGCCLGMLGQLEEANALFRRPIRLPLADGCTTSTAVLELVADAATLPATPDAALPVRRSLAGGGSPVSPDPAVAAVDLVHLICCDSRYFAIFGLPVARSVAARAGVRVLLHFHLVNPRPADHALLQRITAELPSLALRTSVEQTGFGELGPDQVRSYLTCARFLTAPTILAQYGKPLLVTDADQLVVAGLAGLLTEAAAKDVSLLVLPRMGYNLLSYVSASVLLASPTPRAAAFLEAVARYIRGRMVQPEGLNWHLDQAALAAVLLGSSRTAIAHLPPGVLCSTIRRETRVPKPDIPPLFWSVTYSVAANAVKLDEPEFRQFAG